MQVDTQELPASTCGFAHFDRHEVHAWVNTAREMDKTSRIGKIFAEISEMDSVTKRHVREAFAVIGKWKVMNIRAH